MTRVDRLLTGVENAERNFYQDPNSAHKFDEVRKSKIELASYITSSPELKALLRTYMAEPKESESNTAVTHAKQVVGKKGK